MAAPIEYFPPASQLHLTSELRPPHSPPHRTSTSRSLCVVCGRSMPLTKARVFRVHGPLNNRCMGSGMSPSSLTAEVSLPVSAASMHRHSVHQFLSLYLYRTSCLLIPRNPQLFRQMRLSFFYLPSVILPGREFSRGSLGHLVTSQPRSLPPSLTM